MYSKAKVFGHPIHPMLVAYPIAFYTATPILFIVYNLTNDLFWFRVALISNLAGIATAIVAALPGVIDWAMGIPQGHPGKRTGLFHMLANTTALVLFAINAFLQARKWGNSAPNADAAIVITLLGVVITMVAGFLGWTLIAKHHVGVDLTPEQRRYEEPLYNSKDQHPNQWQ